MHKILILIFLLKAAVFAQVSPPGPEAILKQQRPEGWPEWVDVEMDASILANAPLKERCKECFTKAPSLMLELETKALFGENGIYPKEADPQKEPAEAKVKATHSRQFKT